MSRYTILTALMTVLLINSCNEVDYELFPDGYVKILSIKGSGIKDCMAGNTVTEYRDSILILKGGGDPDTDAFASLQVMDMQTACETFGYSSDMIEIIPEEAYSISGDGKISLPGTTRSMYVSMKFAPDVIYEKKLESQGRILVLPLILESQTDTINISSNKILYRFDVRGPLLQWADKGNTTAQIDYLTMEVPIDVNVSYHGSSLQDFECSLDKTGLDVLVSQYNQSHETSYELLPESAYTFTPFTIAAKQETGGTKLALSRTGLVSDKEYLLPMKLNNENMPVEVSSDVKYLIVTNPKYTYKEIDRTGWTIALANATNAGSQWSRPTNLLDDDVIGTHWDSYTAKSYVTPGEDDYVYDHSYPIQHYMSKMRKIPNMLIVVDLGKSQVVSRISISKPSAKNCQDLKACEFYMADDFVFKSVKEGGRTENYNTADDGNDWKKVLTISDVPKTSGTWWYDVPQSVSDADRTGRYVKIRPIEDWGRAEGCCQISDFRVMAAVAVDGVLIEN